MAAFHADVEATGHDPADAFYANEGLRKQWTDTVLAIEAEAAAGPVCLCGQDEGLQLPRLDIVCPKHDEGWEPTQLTEHTLRAEDEKRAAAGTALDVERLARAIAAVARSEGHSEESLEDWPDEYAADIAAAYRAGERGEGNA
jgi:hypothetical protein